jgi:ribosomal protein L10
MPSLPELRARFLGLLQAPAARLVRLLNAPATQVLLVMKARQDKEGGQPA